MAEITLKIEDMPQAYIGKGVDIVDPKIIEENKEKSVKSIKITQKDLEYSIGEIKKTNPS